MISNADGRINITVIPNKKYSTLFKFYQCTTLDISEWCRITYTVLLQLCTFNLHSFEYVWLVPVLFFISKLKHSTYSHKNLTTCRVHIKCWWPQMTCQSGAILQLTHVSFWLVINHTAFISRMKKPAPWAVIRKMLTSLEKKSQSMFGLHSYIN